MNLTELAKGLKAIVLSWFKPIYVTAYRNADFTLGDTAITAVVWDTEEDDSHGMFTAGDTYVTIKKPGRYHVWAVVQFAANSTGVRMLQITRANSSGVHQQNIAIMAVSAASAGTTCLNVAGADVFAEGERVTVGVYQTSGGDLALVGNVWCRLGVEAAY